MNERQNYLLTDLDRTMIFSKCFYKDGEALIPIESKKGEVISYMTKEALRIVQEQSSFIIPVTTRTLAEFKRVKPFQECDWAIVGNGSTILHKGVVLKEWTEHIEKITSPLAEEYDFLIERMIPTSIGLFGLDREEDNDCYVPYLFYHNFSKPKKIAALSQVEMPPLPTKEQERERVLYYLDFCNVWNTFRKNNNLSMAELCTFLYNFAPQYI